jgi:hypothetical protein
MTSSYAGFPDDRGTPVSTTAGFDFAITRDWLLGAAFSGGTTKQTFSPLTEHGPEATSARSIFRSSLGVASGGPIGCGPCCRIAGAFRRRDQPRRPKVA